MARSKEVSWDPDRSGTGKTGVAPEKGGKGKGGEKGGQQKDNSVEAFKAGLEVTPKSLEEDQRRKAMESELAADKAEVELLKHKEELKKAREAAGVKDEKVVAAEALGTTPDKVEKVVEEKVEEATDQVVEQGPNVAKTLEQNGSITSEQSKQVQAALQSPEARGRIKNFFHRMKDSATWGTLSGLAASVAVKGGVRALAISALGPSLPVILGVGAGAGAGVETVRGMWRESKRYHFKENIDKLESETDQYKKAALLNKLEEAYKEQKISGTPEDLNMAADALNRARLHMESVLHSKDSKFEKESDRNKLKFLLDASNANRKELKWSERRAVNQLLKDMDRELKSERKWSNLKGRWGRVGMSALKGATFGTIGAGVGYAVASTDVGPNAWRALKGAFGYADMKAETIPGLIDNGREALKGHEFSEKIGAKGITGAYREMLRDYIIQQKTLDPDYTNNINLERLVYSEDFLKDIAVENGTPQGSGVIKATGSELQKAIDRAMQVDQKGVENIRHLIDGKKHFISKAVRAHMLDWTPGMLNNPDNDAISKIAEEVQDKIVTDGASGEMFAGDRYYPDLVALLVTNAIVEESLLQATKGRPKEGAIESQVKTGDKGVEEPEQPTAPTITGFEVNNEPEKSAVPQEFREKVKQELDEKFKAAGMNVVEVGLVWDEKQNLESQKARVDNLANQFIKSYEKNTASGKMVPMTVEFNFQQDQLSEIKDELYSKDNYDAAHIRIPSQLSDAEYKAGFKEFFDKYSVSEQPAAEEEEPVNDIGEALREGAEAPEEKKWADNRAVLVEKHAYLKEVNVDEDVQKDRRLKPGETYQNLDKILSKIEEYGLLNDKVYKKLKNINLVKTIPADRQKNTLYVKVPFYYSTEKEQNDIMWTLIRSAEKINFKNPDKK